MTKSLACLVIAAATSSTWAAEPQTVNRLVDCAAIPDASQRLACFDREIAPLAQAAAATRSPRPTPDASAPQSARVPAPLPAAPVTQPAAPSPLPSFGEEQLAKRTPETEARQEQTLHARIERLRAGASGNFIVYLDNGQAWRHQDSVLGGYLREGEAITISKGTLGSYRLTRDAGETKNWIRVTRVR